MAIHLVTGQPGHGKTLRALVMAKKFKAEGRTVYVCDVKGINTARTGFLVLDKFQSWEDLPDGSVVVFDECYTALPARGPSKAPPSYVEALARHRHRGFDFILVCQLGTQIDTFVRGLVDRHTHVRRKFGTSYVLLLEWDRYESDLKKPPLIKTRWTLDKATFDDYESATMHTVKRRIPWYVWGLPLLALGVVAAFLYVPASFANRATEIEDREAGEGGSASMFGGGRPKSVVHPGRMLDPAALMRPRVDGAPWTAPAYDDVELAPPPQLACMSSAESCTCLTTDQGTLYRVSHDVCRIMARHGRYDPTRRPAQRPERVQDASHAKPGLPSGVGGLPPTDTARQPRQVMPGTFTAPLSPAVPMAPAAAG